MDGDWASFLLGSTAYFLRHKFDFELARAGTLREIYVNLTHHGQWLESLPQIPNLHSSMVSAKLKI